MISWRTSAQPLDICRISEHSFSATLAVMRHLSVFLAFLFCLSNVSPGLAQSFSYADDCSTNPDNATVVVTADVDPALPNGSSLAPGDTIAVRNESGDCVGYRAWTSGESAQAVAVAGSSSLPSLSSGMQNDAPLSFEVFDESKNEKVDIGRHVDYASCDSVELSLCRADGAYTDGAIFILEAFEPPVHARNITGEDGTGNDAGWRMLSLPAANATRGSLEDDLGASNMANALYRWKNSEWVAQTSSSDSLPRGTGFFLYFYDNESAPITESGLSLDVDYNRENLEVEEKVSNLSQDDDWHLLGNPYEVSFDLDALANGDLASAGFQATVQVWNPNTQQYEQIIQGTSENNIPAWQGFLVQRSTTGEGQSHLTFSPSGRQSDSGNLIGSKTEEDPLVASTKSTSSSTASDQEGRLSLQLRLDDARKKSSHTDRVTYWADGRASDEYDAYEAEDISLASGTYITATLPTLKEDTLVHRALGSASPLNTTSSNRSVPLSVRSVGTSGTATLSWPEPLRAQVPETWNVHLVDTEVDSTVDLRLNNYQFSLDEGKTLSAPHDARFRLNVTGDPLPIELAEFDGTATENGVSLRWKTTSEQGGTGFHLERQAAQDTVTGTNWEQVGFVENAETADGPQIYQFKDQNLPHAADTLRYRLRQLDKNGTSTHTDPIVVARKRVEALKLLGTYPNPARRHVTVRYAIPPSHQSNQNVTFSLYDVMGRQVKRMEASSEAGRHIQQMNISELASGAYFLRLQSQGTLKTTKLTVVR